MVVILPMMVILPMSVTNYNAVTIHLLSMRIYLSPSTIVAILDDRKYFSNQK